MALTKAEIEKTTNQYYDDICKFCIARCGNKNDGMDIAQDVFVLFLEKADTLENRSLKAWLFSVANLKVKEFFKKQKVDKAYLSFEDCDDIADDSEDSSDIVEDFQKMLNDTQKKILDILTDREKEVFIKRL